MRWRATCGVGLAAAVLLLVGCGSAPDGSPLPEASATEEVVCLDEYDDPASLPEVVDVSADFEPVALHRCAGFATRDDQAGTWAGTLLERLEGDLAPFLDVIATPDEPTSLGPCTLEAVIVPELWLTNADGHAIRVEYPLSSCSKPKIREVDAAMADLEIVESTFTPTVLIDSRAAVAAGCLSRGGMLSTLDLREGDAPASDGLALVPWMPPTLPSDEEVSGLRACFYDTAADPLGAFSHSEDWDAVTAHAVLGDVRSEAARATSCDETATVFATLHPLGADGMLVEPQISISVELDGCGRLVDAGLRARSAPAAILELLAG